MSRTACGKNGCPRMRGEFSLIVNRRQAPRLDGRWYCGAACLHEDVERGLRKKWDALELGRSRQFPRPKLGAILMDSLFITADQLDTAVSLQRQTRRGKIGEWLLRLGYVEERQITMALSRQLGLPMIHLGHAEAQSGSARMLPGQVARWSNLVPVGYDDDHGSLRIAISGPNGFQSKEPIRRMIGKGVVTFVGDKSAIETMLERLYPPEELDLSEAPAYSSVEELLELVRPWVDGAVRERAQNLQLELLEDLLWARVDLPRGTRHQFFRRVEAQAFCRPETTLAPQLAVRSPSVH